MHGMASAAVQRAAAMQTAQELLSCSHLQLWGLGSGPVLIFRPPISFIVLQDNSSPERAQLPLFVCTGMEWTATRCARSEPSPFDKWCATCRSAPSSRCALRVRGIFWAPPPSNCLHSFGRPIGGRPGCARVASQPADLCHPAAAATERVMRRGLHRCVWAVAHEAARMGSCGRQWKPGA